MQEVSDRPQFGGVISRILVLSRRTALPEGNTATSSPSSPRAQRKPQAPPRQFAVQFVEHDVGKQWRERTPLRRSFLDYDLRPVRHDHRRLQHQADQGEYPRVRHAFREPGQQALMMNSVEEFGQVQINHRSIPVLQISCRFGDGGMSAALGAEPVTAGVEGRLEDRLQDLEHRLLNHPIHDVRDAQPSLPAAWLWQPDAADFAGPVASLQQVSAQTGGQRRGFRLRRLDRLTIHSWRSLVARYVQQRPSQIGFARCFFEQPTHIGRAGVGTDRLLALRFLQQKVSRPGCVRALSFSVPRRAVGEHEAQLPWSRLSQSISSLAPLAFASLLATMRRSDFCVGVVPSSLPPSGLPLMADPRRPPWVMTLDVPPLPPRVDFGRRVRRHADPAGPACSGVHFRSVLRCASGFFPTRPRGASAGVSRRQGLRAVASSSRLLPLRPRRTFTSNPVPMPGTRRVGAKDYSSAPLTEPDVRASHPALWIDISEVQRELNRNLRRVKVVPQGFERGHPSGEPCRRIGSRHCPNVGLHPCSLASSSRLVSAAPASGPIVFLRFAFATESFAARMRPSAQPFRPPKGCRRTRSSIAVVPSFSIHLLLGSAGFRQPPRYYEEIRLLRGRRPVVVASFGSTARGGPTQTSLGNDTGCPAAPAPTTAPASNGFWASRSKTR